MEIGSLTANYRATKVRDALVVHEFFFAGNPGETLPGNPNRFEIQQLEMSRIWWII
jgi:hypothetical protein